MTDPPTRHTTDTVPKIVPAKMTSLDAISCKRNKSSSRSLALGFLGFHASEIALPKKKKNSELDLWASLTGSVCVLQEESAYFYHRRTTLSSCDVFTPIYCWNLGLDIEATRSVEILFY